MAKICENTHCNKPVGGKLVGIKQDMCPQCEREAQQRVAHARKLMQKWERKAAAK